MRNARRLFVWLFIAALPMLAACSVPRYGDDRALPEVTPAVSATPVAPTSLGPNASLADLLAFASAHNPGIQSAKLRATADAEKMSQARYLPDPMFDFEQAFTESTRKYTVSQMFPNIAKIAAAVEAARWNAELSAQSAEITRNRIRYDVKRTYFDLYLVGKRVALMEEDRKLMTSVKQIAEAKYKAGIEDVTTILKIEVELAKLDNDIRSMKDMAHPMAAMLRATLDAPADLEISLPPRIPEVKLTHEEIALRAMINSGNPQVKASDLMVKTEKAMLLQARAEKKVDITVALMVQDNAMGNGMSSFMVGVNLPLYRGRYEAMERQAMASVAAAERELVDMRNMLGSELSSALFEVRDAERRIALYTGSLVPLAAESLKVSEKSFAA
ncbi:MAG: TolC family protein, partial [Candidatus Brocadiia bacterium]